MSYIWDFTSFNMDCQAHEIINDIKSACKKFGFQLERGDEKGTLHWQGRVSLRKKSDNPVAVAKLFNDTSLAGAHWSLTSKNGADKGVYDYVTKVQTRVEGPWTDKDPPPPIKTRQLLEFLSYDLYKWQVDIMSISQKIDNRVINILYDETGNSGKSSLAEYLEFKSIAYEIPLMNSIEDIMNCVCSVREQGNNPNCWIIDMPRGCKKDKLGQFYSGIECLKNGVAYDKRYSFKKIRFDRPQVIVFTNTLPDFSLLTPDRWIIWQIQDNKSLKDITKQIANDYYPEMLTE